MPLKKGSSKKTVSKNIGELMTGKPGPARAKGIKTLAANRGISPEKAKLVQAKAIALSKAGRSKSEPKRRKVLKKA